MRPLTPRAIALRPRLTLRSLPRAALNKLTKERPTTGTSHMYGLLLRPADRPDLASRDKRGG